MVIVIHFLLYLFALYVAIGRNVTPTYNKSQLYLCSVCCLFST
jgi:hypothetical protein